MYPDPYSTAVAPDSTDCKLLLVCRTWLLARYALAVYRWDKSVNVQRRLFTIRSELKQKLVALPVIREVGAYIIFFGPRSEWMGNFSQAMADNTGLHSIIIQAVHFVDPYVGAMELNQSKWGAIHFGGVDSVSDIIASTLRKGSI